MLSFVPVTLDLYRSVRRHLHWTLQNLIAFADRTGKCFPSVRTLAAATGQPRSTVSRHLAQLADAGVIARQRRPGGCYTYTIASRFLPAARQVSHSRNRAVPRARTEENQTKKTSDFLDDSAQWRARLSAWRSSDGRFWNAFWGPRPDEPGCFAPLALLRAT